MPIDQPPSTAGNTARLFGSLAVMTIGVAGTLVTVLGFFGSAWWAFDLLSGYRMQLAVVLLAVAAGFRIGFGMATGVLFLAAAITNIVIVAPLFLGSRVEALPAEGILTIAGVPVDEAGQQEALEWIIGKPDEDGDIVDASDVDIAFLLDTDDTWTGLAPPPRSGYVTVDQFFIGRQTGMTIIAREGIEVEVERIENTNNPVVRAETKLGDRDIVIYALLLPAPGSDTEARQRNNLLERLAEQIAAETSPVVVIGDIGASQWSHSFRVLTANSVLVDSSPGNGFQGATPGGAWIGLRIPTHHLVHSDSLTVTERHLGPDLGHGRSILQGSIAVAAG